MIPSNINIRQKLYENVIFFFFFCLFLPSDVLQRVKAAVKIYSLIHIAEAFAVSVQVSYSPCSAFFSLSNFLNLNPSTQAVTSGIVRGAGKQAVGAVCNFVGFYIIGLPIGASLMFLFKMGFVGEQCSSVLPKIQCFPAFFFVLHFYITTMDGIQINGLFISCCRDVDRLLNFWFCASCIFRNISL